MPQKTFTVKAFGVEMQVPRWAASALAAVLIIGASYAVYSKVYEQPEKQLITLKEVNKQLSAEVEEYSLHAMEEPQKHELFEDQDGKLSIRVYKDHCVLIQRQSLTLGTRTKLVIDLARAGSIAATRQVAPTALWMPVVEAQPACSRGCLNPHPGNFRWWYGNRTPTGWVEVWRQWPEGCTHVQMFHPASGTWESNPDGSARVRWTCCVH